MQYDPGINVSGLVQGNGRLKANAYSRGILR